jgi:hypothetical protein
MEVPELPRDVWREIMKMRHEKAVEEMMPRWRSEHQKMTTALLKELGEQTQLFTFYRNYEWDPESYTPIRYKEIDSKGVTVCCWFYVGKTEYKGLRNDFDRVFREQQVPWQKYGKLWYLRNLSKDCINGYDFWAMRHPRLLWLLIGAQAILALKFI